MKKQYCFERYMEICRERSRRYFRDSGDSLLAMKKMAYWKGKYQAPESIYYHKKGKVGGVL